MSVNFPRAWEITRAVPKPQHDPKCSYRCLGLLCDCHVLNDHPAVDTITLTREQADQIADALMAGALFVITESRDPDPKSLRNAGLDGTEEQLRSALRLLETVSGSSNARTAGIDLATPTS